MTLSHAQVQPDHFKLNYSIFCLIFFACIIYRLLFLITDPEPLYIPPEYDNVGNSIKVILYRY